MKINVIAVGKIKENYFKDAIGEYAKRLSRFCDFNIIEVDEYRNTKDTAEEINITKNIEGDRLIKKLRGCVIVTDRSGIMFSSEELAEKMRNVTTGGISEISFVIGGSNGLSKAVLDRADAVISFGKVTYPHQLMRVILTEQIYRAFTINSSIKYHK